MAVAVASRASDDLTAAERLDALFDRGTTQFIRTDVVSRRLGPRAVPGDGVLAATGTVDGRPVAAYSQDGTVFGGSLGRAHADTVLRVLDVAERARIPVVAFVESAGARLQEGLDALDGYARIFAAQVRLSGVIPQISVVCGAAAGGGAYGPALSDFVVLTPRASMFLTGPGVVREVLGEVLTASELGGPAVHAANGVAHLLSETELDAITTTRTLLEVLADVDAVPRHPRPVEAPPGGPVDAYVPADPRKGYDVRHVAAGLVDGGRLLEISPGWAPNVTCSFGRIEGRAVGIVANQPSCKAGVLDAD
ncbi:MAG: carboxyl transferase domain-containing protein, partial [Patulibacter sp.]|nr:carboxyl transferase domain-containing protein [Patulibacter sp.]